MEDIHNLLAEVLRKHYTGRSEIILRAREIVKDYINTGTPNYEKTLSMLYHIMKDLPSDILVYFLTTVPLPAQTEHSSHLSTLMKHMLTLSYQKKVRPIMIDYLYDKPPPLVPISNVSTTNKESTSPDSSTNIEVTPSSSTDCEEFSSASLVEHVRSVIDENIQQNKFGKKRITRSRNTNKNSQKKFVRVKPLSHMCSEHIFKSHLFYKSYYLKKKYDALKLLNDKKSDMQTEALCHKVVRDVDKKLEWLKMFSTGKVPLKVIEAEYKDSEVLYRERQRPSAIPDDMMEVTPEITSSVDLFINKC